MSRTIILVSIILGLVIVGLSSIFIVDEREKALVLQFGQIRDVRENPGLAFKIPFIQDVVRYDDRIQSLDTESREVTPLDDRRLVVDAFARWRIADVVRFRQAVGTGGIFQAESRLDQILETNLREVLGSVASNQILSEDRVALMTRIRDAAATEAEALGVNVVDVRIKRADLPPTNLQATFDRMIAEREREAADERARGQEAAQRIRALADRTAVELVSEAQRDSEIIRGEADAERNSIYAGAFGRDPEFFSFYRSLNAYERALGGENSTLVISPDSEFFEYLKSDTGNRAQAPRPASPPSDDGDGSGDASGDASGGGDATDPARDDGAEIRVPSDDPDVALPEGALEPEVIEPLDESMPPAAEPPVPDSVESGEVEVIEGEADNGDTGDGAAGDGDTGEGATGDGAAGNAETGDAETGDAETGDAGTEAPAADDAAN
ncbi:protease modulator HflC [Rhodobacteraceae bacterium 2CG4]|uniref:Protease modulator HflC n=1 Tax=Halovulum marinum TaxID=2662447 RepID=A0A6L5Z0M0_9RHOB|nr:protease modulator HflC [Halovulum marinum]